MALRYVQAKDGKMAGSVPLAGRIPTPARLPRTSRTAPSDHAPGVDYDAMLEAVEGLVGTIPPSSPDDERREQWQGIRDQYTAAGRQGRRILLRNQLLLAEWAAEHPGDIDALRAWHDAQPIGSVDPADRQTLASIALKGRQIMQAWLDDAEDAVRAARQQRKAEQASRARARRSQKGADYTLMTPSVPPPSFENSCASNAQLVAEWSPKNPQPPDKIALSSNGAALFTCPRCQTEWSATVDNRTKQLRKGATRLRINCPECNGYRKASMERAKDAMADYLTLVDGDPQAWESLPPALKHAVIARNGAFSSNGNAFGNAVLLGNLRGDYSITDVLAAREVEDFAERVDEGITEEGALGAATLDGLGAATGGPAEPARTSVDEAARVLSAAGIAQAVEQDTVLVEQIIQCSVTSLWEQAYRAPDDLPDMIDALREQANDPGAPRHKARVAREFLDEYDAVTAQPLPDGYQVEQQRRGTTVTMEPLLHQRRFAYLVGKNRTMANWSGTGSGKTLATALAARQIDAQETIVLCPKGVKPQWLVEFDASFPGVYDIRDGLPGTAEEVQQTFTGKPRVWLLHYEDISSNSREKASRLAKLTDRVDMIVYDEAHYAKRSVPNQGSLRNGVLASFTDAARKSRDAEIEAAPADGTQPKPLAVVMLTATPMKTSLEEVKSLLRILHGPNSPITRFDVADNVKNAAAAHVAIATNSVRHRPEHDQTLTRNEIVVDITPRLGQVKSRIEALRAGSARTAIHPSVMARALLPEKMPRVIERLREINAPTVIYTQHVTGMTSEIGRHLSQAGYTYEVVQSDLSAMERQDLIARFERREFDVLVGSSVIGTGLDGMQRAASNMIVVDMPFTSADDTQLNGRLLRPGQSNDVEIDYILAEARHENAVWSYCRDSRWNRLLYRRSMSDAVTDGIIPEGNLAASGEADVTAAVTAMESMLERMTGPQDV